MKRKKANIICIIAIILLFGITFSYQKLAVNNLTVDMKNVDIESTYILVFVISAFLIFLSLLLYLFIDRYQSLSIKNQIKEEKVQNPINNFSELEFKKEVFDLYLKAKRYYAERKKSALKDILSDELYKEYETKIEKEESEGIKNNIENLKMEDIKLLSVKDNINFYELSVKAHVSYRNYYTNNDNFIVKGDVSKDREEYIILSIIKNKKIKEIKNCPNCYHTITNYESNKCEFCNSIIVSSSDTLKLNREEKVKK